MDTAASLNRLLAVLTERDIGLGYDDLAWLFESAQTRDSMMSWVHEYLAPATLLSPEELDMYVCRKTIHSIKTDVKKARLYLSK
jgi:hypothetical protein